MRATLNLKILAVVGGVLSLTATGLSVYLFFSTIRPSAASDWSWARESLLKHMPQSELRADVDILTSRSDILYPEAYLHRDVTLNQAAKAYPDSARIQLRVAVYGDGSAAAKALRKAAALDTQNALPLYLLAAEAAERESWDEALRLLKQGNQRKHSTEYPIRNTDLPSHGIPDTMIALVLETDFQSYKYSDLRRLARMLSQRAVEIQSQGQTDAALAIIDEVKKMGRAVMERRPGNSIAVLVGIAITRIALKSEKDIYANNGDKAGLARVERDSRETYYLNAGVKAYTGQIMDAVMVGFKRFFAPPLIVGSIGLQIWLTIAYLLAWAISAAESRHRQGSELHLKATERAFPTKKLILYYFLFFVPAGVAASYVFYKTFPNLEHDLTLPIAAGLSAMPVLLGIFAHRSYKLALRKQAEVEGVDASMFARKRATWQEKREFNVRMVGVHGGALLFLTVLGLAISMWMKVSLGSFPWQLDYVSLGGLKEESQYVSNLLAHKIDIPESAIRAEQKKDEEHAKQSGQ